MFKVTPLLVVLLLPAFAQSQVKYSRHNLVFEQTFENPAAAFRSLHKDTCCPHSLEISDTSSYGRRSLRFKILSTDGPLVNQSYRSSVVPLFGGSTNTANQTYLYGTDSTQFEAWFGLSILLPKNHITDPDGEIITDFHDNPDLAQGEPYKAAAVQLELINGKYGIRVAWDTVRVNLKGEVQRYQMYPLGQAKLGVWIDWVYHVRWSNSNTGLLEIWKDGVKVVSRINQPNTFDDHNPPYFKVGIYKYSWGFNSAYAAKRHFTTEREMYVDEIRVGNRNATYKDVAPSHISSQSKASIHT